MDTVVTLLTDPVFWIGFAVPIIVMVLWVIVGWIGAAWNGVLQFFQETQVPGPAPANDGPSPFASLMNCFVSLAVLLVVLGLLGVLIYSWLT